MPEANAFDTHNFVKHMTSGGFTQEQAEADKRNEAARHDASRTGR